MAKISALFLLAFFTLNISAQEASIWTTLRTVSFELEYDDMLGLDVPIPQFGPWIKELENKEIDVEGYLIPLKGASKQDYFMFSALPYEMCFFCGKAGPETAMEVYMKKGETLKYSDKSIVLSGTLELNDRDAMRPIYLLRNATLTSKK